MARCKACTDKSCSRRTCSRSAPPGWCCRPQPCSSFDIESKDRSRRKCGARARRVRTTEVRDCKNAHPDSGCLESAASAVELQWLPCHFLQISELSLRSRPKI